MGLDQNLLQKSIELEDVGRGKSNNVSNNNNNNKGGRRKGKPSRRKKKFSFLIPLKESESHQRVWRDKPEYWCPNCEKWRRHKLDQHDEWIAEKRLREAGGNTVSQAMDPLVLYIKYADEEESEVEPPNNLRGTSSFE